MTATGPKIGATAASRPGAVSGGGETDMAAQRAKNGAGE